MQSAFNKICPLDCLQGQIVSDVDGVCPFIEYSGQKRAASNEICPLDCL